jgi:prepilin-type N-terminal cleavage/methylation domain-containing protein
MGYGENMAVVSRKNGFSLVEIIIAMGVASIGLLFMMKMQGEQAKNAATAKANSESEVIIGDLRGLLTRSGYCATSLNGLTLPDSGFAPIANIRSPAGRIAYAPGMKLAENSLLIKEIAVKNFEPETTNALSGIATFEITLEKLKSTYGAKTIKRSMNISVDRDASKKIVDCSSLLASGISVTPGEVSKHISPETVAKVINETKPTSQTEEAAITETKKIIEGSKDLKETMEALKSLKKMNEEMEKRLLEEDPDSLPE